MCTCVCVFLCVCSFGHYHGTNHLISTCPSTAVHGWPQEHCYQIVLYLCSSFPLCPLSLEMASPPLFPFNMTSFSLICLSHPLIKHRNPMALIILLIILGVSVMLIQSFFSIYGWHEFLRAYLGNCTWCQNDTKPYTHPSEQEMFLADQYLKGGGRDFRSTALERDLRPGK